MTQGSLPELDKAVDEPAVVLPLSSRKEVQHPEHTPSPRHVKAAAAHPVLVEAVPRQIVPPESAPPLAGVVPLLKSSLCSTQEVVGAIEVGTAVLAVFIRARGPSD